MSKKKQSGFVHFFDSGKGKIVAALLVLLAVATGMLILKSFFTEKVVVLQKAPIITAMAENEEPEDANSEISGKYYGLCKKNSIGSVEDFRKTVDNDPALASHFSGFKWKDARLGKHDNDVWTFVSYRKGDVIRRTSKPVMLPKGDRYITDGVRFVRTYCCNDFEIAPPPMKVSLSSAEPIERVDAPHRRINKMTEPVQLVSMGPATEDPTGTKPELPGYLASPNFYHGPPGFSPDSPLQPRISSAYISPTNNDPAPVPEPGTFLLTGGGMAAYGLYCLLRRKRAEK